MFMLHNNRNSKFDIAFTIVITVITISILIVTRLT